MLNKACVLGYVGGDPHINEYNTVISIATTEKWKDKKTGERKERTDWHRIVFYGPLGTIVAQYVKKGSLLYVEGAMRIRTWIDKESGQEKKIFEILGREMQMISTNSKEFTPASKAPSVAKSMHNAMQDELNDDIPF